MNVVDRRFSMLVMSVVDHRFSMPAMSVVDRRFSMLVISVVDRRFSMLAMSVVDRRFSMLVMSVVDCRFSMLAMSVVDRRCEAQSDQTKDYKIGIRCFSAKYTALRSKRKDWLARNVRVKLHVYPQTVVSVKQHNKNRTK